MWLIAPIARLTSGPRTTVRDGRPEIPERMSLLALKIFECQAMGWYAGRLSPVKKLVGAVWYRKYAFTSQQYPAHRSCLTLLSSDFSSQICVWSMPVFN